MRTNIEIDDELLKQAMRSTGEKTKKAVVEAGLRKLVQLKRQTSIRKLRGTLQWEGNLAEMRQSRFGNWED